MHRRVNIVVALMAVLLLVRPLDCFGGVQLDKKSADCCNKGKCSPSNPDACCKASTPSGTQIAATRAIDHSAPVLNYVVTEIPRAELPTSADARFIEGQQPPGSPPNLRLNLPLLI